MNAYIFVVLGLIGVALIVATYFQDWREDRRARRRIRRMLTAKEDN